MYIIRNRVGKGNSKGVTIIIKKQNSDEKVFHFTLAKSSTIEAKNIIEEGLKLFEDRMAVSDVLVILNSIIAQTSDTTTQAYIRDIMKKIRGDK